MRSRWKSWPTATGASACTSPRPRWECRAIRMATGSPHSASPPYTCPERKITMLPDSVVEAFTLCADRVCPALSMYNEIDGETLAILGHESRVERIHIAANLRHDTLEPLFNEETLAAGKLDYPYANELALLWKLVQKLEEGRGKPADNSAQQMDYNFHIEGDPDRRKLPGQHHAAAPRLADRQGGLRADDPGEQRMGQASCRARFRRHLPHPAERQGEDEHGRRAAPGAGRGAIHVVELAAAPLCGHGQPAPDHRDAARRGAGLPEERPRAVHHDARLRYDVRYLWRIPEEHGALLVSALAAAGKHRATGWHRAARKPGETRRHPAGRPRAIAAGIAGEFPRVIGDRRDRPA